MLARSLSAASRLGYLARVHTFEALLSFVWFTILPLARATDHVRGQDEEFTYTISIYQYYYLPLVGVAKFLLVFGLMTAAATIWHPVFAALIGAVTYILLSGAIHLDGLTDTFDALFAYGKDKWAVLKDPHCGALGAAYLNLYLWLFIPTFAYNLYWLHGHGTWVHALILAHACLLPKLNCYAILHDSIDSGKLQLDQHLTLQPQYDFWSSKKLTSTVGFYGICFLVLMAELSVTAFSSALIFYLLSAFGVLLYLNLVIIPRVVKSLGFLAGDVFGFMICLAELAHQLLFTLWFVRDV